MDPIIIFLGLHDGAHISYKDVYAFLHKIFSNSQLMDIMNILQN